MEPAVKWLYAADTEQQRPSLCLIHDDQMLCVQAGSVVRLIVREAKEFMGTRNVVENNKAYSVKKAVAKLREIGQRIGITKQANMLLMTVETDDSTTLDGVVFRDEEGKTMQEEDEIENEEEVVESAPPAMKTKQFKKLLKGVKEAGEIARGEQKPARKTVVIETETKTKATPVKGKKDTVATNKNAKKTVTKTNTKAKTKPAAPKAKATKAAAGEGGFRAGTNMEKGFIAYKAARKEYLAFERGDKQIWAQKLADKLDTTLNSVRTMISKNWEPLLTK